MTSAGAYSFLSPSFGRYRPEADVFPTKKTRFDPTAKAGPKSALTDSLIRFLQYDVRRHGNVSRVLRSVVLAGRRVHGPRLRNVEKLSPKWKGVCRSLIESNGPNFDCSLGQSLSHIRVKLASNGQAGLGMFFVWDELVLSTAYLCGNNANSVEVLRTFLQSLRKSPCARDNVQAFPENDQLNDRPLHIVVPWGASTSANDESVIRELSAHFAAAFFEAACENAA